MNKEVRQVRGKYQLLLGVKDKCKYWLQQPTFDCGWYWGIGYVEAYNGNGSSDKTWRSHQHFDELFLKPAKFVDGFKEFFDETPLTDREVWKLLELMQSAYIARRYSDMLSTGGEHITKNECSNIITNEAEYKRINEIMIPEIMKQVYKLLSEKTEDEQ